MKHLGSSLHDFLIYIVLCSQLSLMVNTIAFKLLDRMVVGGWRDVPIDSVFPLRNFYYLSNCCIVFLFPVLGICDSFFHSGVSYS